MLLFFRVLIQKRVSHSLWFATTVSTFSCGFSLLSNQKNAAGFLQIHRLQTEELKTSSSDSNVAIWMLAQWVMLEFILSYSMFLSLQGN